MGSIDDIMQLCRLCLVKDQVNIPIFDESSDIRQTFLKINACLPVKVSRDDNLPKKICDGCSYKLDMLYIFRNTSVDSEKQLITWLNQAGLTSLSQAVKDGAKPEIMVKQETFETNDSRIEDNPDMGTDAHGEIEDQHPEMGVDAHSYIIQQQKLPYQQDFAFGEPSGSTAGLMAEEPAPKRAKRAASVKKHVPIETEEDELVEAAMQITKAEEEDSDDIDQPEYVEAPSTSADDQPGPSGVGKGTIEAPLDGENSTPSTQKKIWTCYACKATFDSRRLHHRHRRDVHMKYEHACLACGKMFKERSELKLHSLSHVEGKPYECDLCGRRYKNPYTYNNHRKVHNDAGVTYECPVCHKVFDHLMKTSFKNHVKRHQETKINCDVCGKVCYGETMFNKHKLQHDKNKMEEKGTPKFPCHICEQVLTSKSGYEQHVERHSAGKQYLCDVCGKGISSRSSFRTHARTHTGEKPFACTCCDKKFNSNQLLKVHMAVHTKEKPILCKFCDKRYTQHASLTLHIRAAHSGERPYPCNVCPKKFISKTLLNTHLKTH